MAFTDAWHSWPGPEPFGVPCDYSLGLGRGKGPGWLAPAQRGCSPLLPAPILSWREGISSWSGWPLPAPLWTSVLPVQPSRMPSSPYFASKSHPFSEAPLGSTWP